MGSITLKGEGEREEEGEEEGEGERVVCLEEGGGGQRLQSSVVHDNSYCMVCLYLYKNI